MKTGAQFKARRLELKITQQDLADKIGVSSTQLSRMENETIDIPDFVKERIESVLYLKIADLKVGDEIYSKTDLSELEYVDPSKELTIKDIQAGDELECIDREKYNAIRPYHNLIEKFIVSKVGDLGACINDGDWIIELHELKYFRKKPKLQFSDLEVGDYVYVRDDLERGKTYGGYYYEDEMSMGVHEVSNIYNSGIKIKDNEDFLYTHEMLDLSRSMKKEDYLKMKEVKSNESFYELQEVAFQAYKDGLINNVAFENKLAPSLIRIDGNVIFDQHVSYKKDIDRLKSLYTEEFVIECKDDCKRIKQMAEITFLNGNSVVMDQPPTDDGIVRIWNDGRYDFAVLKGATVKQQKGTK